MTSTFVVLNILTCQKNRSHYFQQLCVVFALSDMMQTFPTFLGDYGVVNKNYTLCSIQNYGLTLGFLCKLATVVVINSVCWYIVEHLATPRDTGMILPLALLIAYLVVITCIVLRTADVYCTYYDYDEENLNGKLALDYLIFTLSLVYCTFAFIIFLCVTISRKVAILPVISSEIEIYSHLNRLQLIPICLISCFIPVTICFIYIFVNGTVLRDGYPYSIAGVAISINGFLTGCFYFWHQRQVCYMIFKVKGFFSSLFKVKIVNTIVNPLRESESLNSSQFSVRESQLSYYNDESESFLNTKMLHEEYED